MILVIATIMLTIITLMATIVFFVLTSKSYQKAGIETLGRLNDKTARVKELEAMALGNLKKY